MILCFDWRASLAMRSKNCPFFLVYATSSHCYYRSHIESYMWLILNSAIFMTLSDLQVHSVIISVFESNAVYSCNCAAFNLECHAVPLQLLSQSYGRTN